jgi:hypothetical protein
LEFELLWQVRREPGGFLRFLDLFVELVQLGLDGATAVLGPAVEFVYLGVEPQAILTQCGVLE